MLLPIISWDRESECLTFLLGRNVPVYIHWTFAVPIMLPFASEWSTRPLDALIHTSIWAALIFSAVLLHELGHLWAARSRGIGVECIDLYLFGGRIYFRATERHTSWIWVSFAGPLVNIVLGLLFLAGYFVAASFGEALPYDPRFSVAPPWALSLPEWTLRLGAILNLALAALNLLPAFPLDGGTIARELLLARAGPQRATRIVGICGLLLSILRILVILPAAVGGFLVWLPPPFRENWRAARGTRKTRPRGRGAKPPKTETVEWRGKGGWPIRK